MELTLAKDQFNNPSICVNHRGQILYFYSSSLKVEPTIEMFEPVNRFLRTQSEQVQDALFDVYARIRAYITDNMLGPINVSKHEEQLREFFREIFDLVPLQVFFQYMQWKETIVMPSNVYEQVEYDIDGERTEAKTYLAYDYKNLVNLITYVRLAAPFISELNHVYRDRVRLLNLKIWQLMSFTPVVENEVINKLLTYIRSITSNKNDKTMIQIDGMVMDIGLSYEDIEQMIVAHVFLGKPFTMDFTSAHSNIISTIFNYIKYLNNSSQEKPGEIMSKTHAGDPNKEDMSYFEDYRKTTDIPLGGSVEIEFFLKDHYRLIDNLNMWMYYDEELFKTTRRYLAEHFSKHPNPIQFRLLGWFLNRYINHRAVWYLSKGTVISNMALMSSLMWNAGEHFISLLMSSNSIKEDHPSTAFVRTTLSTRDRELLAEKFSFYKKNDILEGGICQLAREITHYQWKPIMPNYLVDGYGSRKEVTIPNELTSSIVNFLVRFT